MAVLSLCKDNIIKVNNRQQAPNAVRMQHIQLLLCKWHIMLTSSTGDDTEAGCSVHGDLDLCTGMFLESVILLVDM